MNAEINIFLSILSVWLVIFVNFQFLQPTKRNESRFKLYKYRDQLAHIAMKNEIDENSLEYKLLIGIINNAIQVTGTFKVTDFLAYVYAYHDDVKLQSSVREVKEMLTQQENSEYCNIAADVFETLNIMLTKDTYVLRKIMVPVTKFLKLFRLKKPSRQVANRVKIVNEVDHQWERLSEQFSRC